MKDKEGHTGWAGGREPIAPDPGRSEQMTRVVAVDPLTGQVAAGTAHNTAHRSEVTLALSPKSRPGNARPEVWAEFAPLLGRQGKDVETRIWMQDRKHSLWAMGKIILSRLKKNAGEKPARFAIVALAFAAIGALAIAKSSGISPFSRAIPEEERGRVAFAREDQIVAKCGREGERCLPSDLPAESAAPRERSRDLPSLDRAASALIDGRLDEALAEYRLLQDRYPENRSYALTVDILTASERRDGR